MKVIVVGMGVQGRKRLAVAGTDAVATVDPVSADAGYRKVEDVPLASYDAALVCTPDGAKVPALTYLLANGKHVLVEKPLVSKSNSDLERLRETANTSRLACYTAYNHRFEPHIVRLKRVLESGVLGRVYLAKFFYGNGTAREVRNSPWRDKGMGVFPDLGSHLLDWTLFLFGKPSSTADVWRSASFENLSNDFFHFGFRKNSPEIDFEVTLLSWRNTFRCDIFAEFGSVHIDCLCKWGPSVFTQRKRILPSGRPTEDTETIICPDPTWSLEYEHFLHLCKSPTTNIDNDIWINSVLNSVAAQVTAR